MSQNEFQIGDKIIGGISTRVYVVAEVGINHGGSCTEAKRLIDAAAKCGADAVKFQTFHANRLLVASQKRYGQQEPGAESAYEMFRRFELSWDDHQQLKMYADSRGIQFFSTPFDEESVDQLDALGVPAFKIASSDITHVPLLRRIASKGKPILLSTGMSYLQEVTDAVEVLRGAGARQIMLLHCVSSYPARHECLNLRAISTLRRQFDLPVGYSDHSQGILAALLAAALGADLIEKHFTLDRSAPGPDHKLSMDPIELRELVQNLRIVEKSLGTGLKSPSDTEVEIRGLSRRSIVAAVDIQAGEKIQPEMLTFKRPGTGLPPGDLDRVVGMVARQSIRADSLLQSDDLVPAPTPQINSERSRQIARAAFSGPLSPVPEDELHE
jgi:N,N'-diacetyllegionaminate synthase